MGESAAQIVIARPYGAKIRKKMAHALRSAGLDYDAAIVIPEKTPDEAVAQALPRGDNLVLVIPFHAHRDDDGNVVNGLDVVAKIALERPDLQDAPILMPVSAMGHGGASLRLARWEEKDDARASLNQRVLLMPEEDIDTVDGMTALKRHLRARGSVTASSPTASQSLEPPPSRAWAADSFKAPTNGD